MTAFSILGASGFAYHGGIGVFGLMASSSAIVIPAIFLFVLNVALMSPYRLIGVMGGGLTLNQITQGAIPSWVGSLLVCVIVLIYVGFGGVRGTAWANAFQALVFVTLGVLTVFLIVADMGDWRERWRR